MASVHKFWYFLLVTYLFSLKILIFGLNFTYDIFRTVMAWASSQALHMVSFENFVKSMPPSLSELKVIPSFCFAFKIPDDVTATNTYKVLDKFPQTNLSQEFFFKKLCFYFAEKSRSLHRRLTARQQHHTSGRHYIQLSRSGHYALNFRSSSNNYLKHFHAL